MKMLTRISWLGGMAGTLLVSTALASPSLKITKPPVMPMNSTGPMIDPTAKEGQWFLETQNMKQTVRTHEFYDNVFGDGGSPTVGSLAIMGKCVSIQRNVNNQIVGFVIQATITNDTVVTAPGEYGPWEDGSNSHGETLTTNTKYQGTMYGTMLAIEFAVADASTVPASWTAPYSSAWYVEAANEDALAWYCYTPSGDYYVPTWNFGDIDPGQSVTRDLQFVVPGGLSSGVYINLLENSFQSGDDLLMNRTTSLKISHWMEYLGKDDGSAYPTPNGVDLASDCSVFHNIPEPASMALLGLAGLTMLQRRR